MRGGQEVYFSLSDNVISCIYMTLERLSRHYLARRHLKVPIADGHVPSRQNVTAKHFDSAISDRVCRMAPGLVRAIEGVGNHPFSVLRHGSENLALSNHLRRAEYTTLFTNLIGEAQEVELPGKKTIGGTPIVKSKYGGVVPVLVSCRGGALE